MPVLSRKDSSMPSTVRIFGAAASLGVALAGLDSANATNALPVAAGNTPGRHLSFPPYVRSGGAQGSGRPEQLSSADPYAFTTEPTPGSGNAVDTSGALEVLIPVGVGVLGLGASACGIACRRRAQARQGNPGVVPAPLDQRAAYRALRVVPPEVVQPLLIHVEQSAGPPADEVQDHVLPDGIEPSALGVPLGGTYIPSMVEERPSEELSRELAKLQRENWQVDDVRVPQEFQFVRQSEGRASVGQPLVSVGFTTCSAFLTVNVDAKEGEPKCLMLHHDSGYRSTWRETKDETGAGPVSPCTPTRRFIGRPRVGYDEFQKTPGRKLMLLIESDIACDRREDWENLASENVRLMPPLTMKTAGTSGGNAECTWSVAYRPESDELMIHFRNFDVEKVMHFKDDFSGADMREGVRRDDARRGSGDIVDRMREYRNLLRRPGAVSETAREAMELCLKVIELRHVDFRAACVQLRSILDLAAVRDPGVREAGPELEALLEVLAIEEDHIEQWLRTDLLHKDSDVVRGLTQLLEHLLAQERQGPEST
jgi:hypothetical protein